jgi:hypothetical protein
MKNPYLEQARKIVAQAHAKANTGRLNLARKRCYQLAMAACLVAGLGYISFGIQFLLFGSQAGALVFSGLTISAILVAWTAALCMSFNARPSLEVSR